MIPIKEIFLFATATLILAITPGPNMIYLISRSLSQGRKAGMVSLLGVLCGFLFHIIMVSYGLTAVFFAIPMAYDLVKYIGAGYLIYLAFAAVGSKGENIFNQDKKLQQDNWIKLFNMGFFTNVLNPKMAIFYISFFPQFIKPEYGSILAQSFELGLTQIMISFMVNFIIILSAARMSGWFSKNPLWVKVQKFFMASVLTGLALKMAFSKAK
ncbi:MAG: LysE family translocator [Bacteroidota bacterium]